MTTKLTYYPSNTNILVVENERLIALDIADILTEAGYAAVFTAADVASAKALLAKEKIDLALLDIQLDGSETGVDLAKWLNVHGAIPFVFITSFSDRATVHGLKLTNPAGFVLKPFTDAMLLAVLEIALHNYYEATPIEKEAANTVEEELTTLDEQFNCVVRDFLLIKENFQFVKVPLYEVLWFESDRNYLAVKTKTKKYMIRCSLKKMLSQLPKDQFVKCYKNYIINIHFAQTFSKETVQIFGHSIPISRQSQSEVMKALMRS